MTGKIIGFPPRGPASTGDEALLHSLRDYLLAINERAADPVKVRHLVTEALDLIDGTSGGGAQ